MIPGSDLFTVENMKNILRGIGERFQRLEDKITVLECENQVMNKTLEEVYQLAEMNEEKIQKLFGDDV